MNTDESCSIRSPADKTPGTELNNVFAAGRRKRDKTSQHRPFETLFQRGRDGARPSKFLAARIAYRNGGTASVPSSEFETGSHQISLDHRPAPLLLPYRPLSELESGSSWSKFAQPPARPEVRSALALRSSERAAPRSEVGPQCLRGQSGSSTAASAATKRCRRRECLPQQRCRRAVLTSGPVSAPSGPLRRQQRSRTRYRSPYPAVPGACARSG